MAIFSHDVEENYSRVRVFDDILARQAAARRSARPQTAPSSAPGRLLLSSSSSSPRCVSAGAPQQAVQGARKTTYRFVDTKCPSGCCSIQRVLVQNAPRFDWRSMKRSKHKAGVFVYNAKRGSVLLVQSRGCAFGLPKGSLEPDETQREAAVRELREETGIVLNPTELSNYLLIKNSGFYFLKNVEHEIGGIPKPFDPVNDVTGFTWIKISCLRDMLAQKCIDFQLNSHTRAIIRQFFNLDLPPGLQVSRKR